MKIKENFAEERCCSKNTYFQHQISEKEFMEDYERCKKIVDSGIDDYSMSPSRNFRIKTKWY